MPKKRRKKKKRQPKTKKPQSNIPESASTTRFLIFLAIGLILFGIYYYFAYVRGGGGAMEELGQ
jgi:hypothetical protein